MSKILVLTKIENKAAKESFIKRGLRFFVNRPMQIWGSLRGYGLFLWSRPWTRLLFSRSKCVTLGSNVRLQKVHSINAERPSAKISIGEHSIVYENASLNALGTGQVEIGEYAMLGDIKIFSRYEIKIGKRFLSSWNVFIQDYDPHPIDADKRGMQVVTMCEQFRPRFAPKSMKEYDPFLWGFPGTPIEIGDDVWICANCTILKGARIGSGCIVASSSVVLAGEYPSRSLIAGNPARVVRSL